LPDEDSGDFSTMFNARRLQTAKAALEPRLRCTEVDEHGKVILVDGEFKKSELIAKVRHLGICISSPSDRLLSMGYCPVIFVRSTRPTYLISSSDQPLSL